MTKPTQNNLKMAGRRIKFSRGRSQFTRVQGTTHSLIRELDRLRMYTARTAHQMQRMNAILGELEVRAKRYGMTARELINKTNVKCPIR